MNAKAAMRILFIVFFFLDNFFCYNYVDISLKLYVLDICNNNRDKTLEKIVHVRGHAWRTVKQVILTLVSSTCEIVYV